MSKMVWAAAIAILFFVVTVGFGATAYSPKKGGLHIWEPCWELSRSPGNAIVNRITDNQGKKQGYTVVRWQDDTYNNSVDDCTRVRFDALDNDAGVLFVHSHGNDGFFDGIFVDENSQQVALDWADGDAGLFVQKNLIRKYWFVGVQGTWLSNNWKNTLSNNNNRAIVVLESCTSSSLLDDVGGRIGFGYTGTVTAATGASDFDIFFDRMNGIDDDATKRKAGEAYDAGGWTDGSTFTKYVEQAAYNDTTLCPAPLKTDGYSPVGEVGCEGGGWIALDTHCDNTVRADQALTFQVTGNCNITDVGWVDDDRIIFSFDGTGQFTVTVTAHANLIKAKSCTQQMDGNRVAPNEDDLVWQFYHNP